MSRWAFSLLLLAAAASAQVPRDALRYQRELTGNARMVWGLDAPVATFAAQVHQESSWRPDAASKYASGLAQFTPDTADWIAMAYPGELAGAQPLNPSWALRALVRYDWHLYRAMPGSGCDRMAFTLAGYNGGPGWIQKEARAARAAGADPARWWGNVEHHCIRAGWACRENREYPHRILRVLEPRYEGWGPGSC